MLEKFGHIKNPLTIIAIFAGIAEVSGTVVLPFIVGNNQNIFVWFLVIFPSALVILFFITLNCNHKVLYAPSDYKDEENFVKTIKKFDYNKLEKKEERIILEPSKIIIQKKYEEKCNIKISNFKNAVPLIKLYESEGYPAEIYMNAGEDNYSKPSEHKAIWLGSNISPKEAVRAIMIAKEFYPHIEYIHLSSDSPSDPPEYIHDEIYIGGATSTANEYGLKKISVKAFSELNANMTKKELHKFVRSFY